jgi:hypothetical protein
MGTRITVTSSSDALLASARQVQQANREAQLQRERDGRTTATATAEVQATTLQPPLGGSPDTSISRRPSAQRSGLGWGLWTADWLATSRAGEVEVVGSTGNTELKDYLYIEAKDLRLLASNQSNKPTDTPVVTGSFPQAGYVYSAPTNSTSALLGGLQYAGYNGGEFAGATFSGGNYFFTQAPVVSSNTGVLYGVQRHAVTYTNTPWTRLISGPVSPNGVTTSYLYLYFKFNTKTGKVDLRSDTASFTAEIATPELRAPYVEGGAIWAAKYAENAFVGDPSLSLRELGYYGDYHIKNGTASFLRLNPVDSSVYFNLFSRDVRSLWNMGSQLAWITLPITASTPAALKAELETFLVSSPPSPFTRTPALKSQAEIDDYNALSSAVINSILPSGGDQFWSPTGPHLYPLFTPP